MKIFRLYPCSSQARLLFCILLTVLYSVSALYIVDTHAYAKAASSLPVQEFPAPTTPGASSKLIAGGQNDLWFLDPQFGRVARITTQGKTSMVPHGPLDHVGDVAWSNPYVWFINNWDLYYYNPQTGQSAYTFVDTLQNKVNKHNEPDKRGIQIPRALASGANGNLWVLTDNYLFLVTSTFQTSFFVLPSQECHGAIQAMTSDRDGNLWFTVPSQQGVGSVTLSGQFSFYPLPGLTPLPSYNTFPQTAPITLASDGNLWFFMYPYRNGIWRITPKGVLTSYPVPATFYMFGWSSIASALDGSLWFSDTPDNQLIQMRPDGKFNPYPIPTANSQPISLVLGPDGNIWFSESNNYHIGRLDLHAISTSSKTPLHEFPTPQYPVSPEQIITGPGGDLWFNSQYGNVIERMTLQEKITPYMLPIGQRAESLASGPDGNLWFTSPPNLLGRLTPAGELTEYQTISGNKPREITVGPDGRLWFLVGNNWGTVTVDGLVSEYTFPSGTNASGGEIAHMVRGPDGNMWATEYGDGGYIARITPQSKVTEFFVSPPSPPDGSLTPLPNNIILGPDGDLWFTELNNGSIIRMTSQGTLEGTFNGFGDGNGYGIISSLDGDIWAIGDIGRYKYLVRVTPAGVITKYSLSFDVPIQSSLAQTVDGSLWFTSTEQNLIGRANLNAVHSS